MVFFNHMLKRYIESKLRERLFSGKTILLLGPRQVGKTTLAQAVMQQFPGPDALWLTGDDPAAVQVLSGATLARLRGMVGQHRLIVVDEAQRIPNIGSTLKLLHDNFPGIQVLATGSSALDLAEQTSEPLTGRKLEYLMLPFSFAELVAHHGLVEERGSIGDRLVFGSYPEVITQPSRAREALNLLANSYLYKDLFRLEQLKKPALLENIVRALAFQVGAEVSYNEIGQLVGSAPQTVEKYVDLLEKAFIVFRLPSLSQNARNEIKKGRKVYFYDNGIRNAVIGNFAPLETRTDVGALWENYLVAERYKFVEQQQSFAKRYFWRTVDQQEIDYIEALDGLYSGYEFKWNPKQAKAKMPAAFAKNYAPNHFSVITPENYDTFLLGEDH
jgi:hypothetical protein